MIKKSLPYCFELLKISVPVTILITILTALRLSDQLTVERLAHWLFIGFLTGGYISGFLFFEFSRYREYYFYNNLGLSKLRLVFTAWMFHLLVSIPLIILMYVFYT
jgi:hypothetical protein